jgi:nitrile hydratase
VFHEAWEARLFAIRHALGAWGKWNIDASRHARELIPPADYLRMGYYERWLAGLETQMLEVGLVTAAELRSGTPAPDVPKVEPALRPEGLARLFAGAPSGRASAGEPVYRVSDRVRARNVQPLGHTRLPRYVRGKYGTIVRLHGTHVLPDSNAHGRGEQPQPLYGVRFDASELWGATAGPREAVHLDLWESYLEPA